MPDAEPDQTVIVKAPGILCNPAAFKRIFDIIPDVKMLLVVRTPIDKRTILVREEFFSTSLH